MLLAMVAIAILSDEIKQTPFIGFALESIMVMIFGFAWLKKAKAPLTALIGISPKEKTQAGDP